MKKKYELSYEKKILIIIIILYRIYMIKDFVESIKVFLVDILRKKKNLSRDDN